MVSEYLVVLTCLLTVGCNGKLASKADEDEFVPIAVVSGTDHETQEIMEKVLLEQQIECFFDGSIAYGLHVKKRHAALAINAIQTSNALKNRTFEIEK